MTIACATHFTPSSDEAVLVAAALARQSGEPLRLATVLTAPDQYAAARLRQTRAATRSLQLEADRMRLRGLKVESELLIGPLDTSLGDFCRATSARLLVVGDSRLRAARITPPLEQLLAALSVPMLVVHSVRPFLAWSEGRPLELLLGVDHSWTSALAVNWVGALAKWGPVRVTAMHVWKPEREFKRRGLESSDDNATQAKLAVDLHRETESALEALPEEVTRHVHLELGETADVASHLLQVAGSAEADLLVVGSNPQQGVLGLLRSVSQEVLARAPVGTPTW